MHSLLCPFYLSMPPLALDRRRLASLKPLLCRCGFHLLEDCPHGATAFAAVHISFLVRAAQAGIIEAQPAQLLFEHAAGAPTVCDHETREFLNYFYVRATEYLSDVFVAHLFLFFLPTNPSGCCV
jgi:hypothetical protein